MDNLTQEQSSKKTTILNKLIKIVLPLVLGVLILYFLFRDMNFEELWGVLKDANFGILAFSLIFGLLGNTIRGYRWQLLIKPLGYHPKVSNLNYAIYGGYAVNFAIPRAGEIWRCGIIAKEDKVPFTKLFGTMILDRILDTLTVFLICLVAFLLNMEFFISQLEHNQSAFDTVINILSSPLLYVGIVAIAILIFVVFKFFKENFIVKKITGFMKTMSQDMKAIWKMKQKNRLFLYTIGIWGSYFCYFYMTFFAFDFTANLGITAGLIAFALSSLSMGVPTNGGMGAWHVAVIAALSLYGVDKISAVAFATGVFAIQSLWVIACGLFGIGALAVKNRHNK